MYTYNKFHRVRVGELKLSSNVLGLGQFQRFRLDGAGKLLTAGQLDLSSYYPTISKVILCTAFVIGDDEMNMVENICGSFIV